MSIHGVSTPQQAASWLVGYYCGMAANLTAAEEASLKEHARCAAEIHFTGKTYLGPVAIAGMTAYVKRIEQHQRAVRDLDF